MPAIIRLNRRIQCGNLNIAPEKSGQTYCETHSGDLNGKMDNSLPAVRSMNHKYIVVEKERETMIKVTANVDGMMCGMCEAHVNDAVRAAFNVKKVTSSHSKGITEVISEEPVDEEKLRQTIEATGYKVTGIQTEPYEKKGFSLFRK